MRRHLRSRSLLLVAVTVLAVLVVGGGAPAHGPVLTVMTRNLYVGSGLFDLVGVRSLDELVAAATGDWANVLATDFRARAGALADEIVTARPDVVGLQEVTLWRDQTPGDVVGARPTVRPNATHVVFDFLAILQAALADRGSPYTAAAVSTNADLQVPRRGAGGVVDMRATDRDVLLVRADRADRVSNAATGHYAAQLMLPSLPVPIRNTRGWAAIDYRAGPGTTVRVITTHLEISGREAGRVQVEQADELLALVAASPHPVVVLGDVNSPADGSGTATYTQLTRVLDDAWLAARPADPGPTCCQRELLGNPVGREDGRIDLVLTTGDWSVDRVARTGAEPFRRAPPPLWASDHLGVTARLTTPR